MRPKKSFLLAFGGVSAIAVVLLGLSMDDCRDALIDLMDGRVVFADCDTRSCPAPPGPCTDMGSSCTCNDGTCSIRTKPKRHLQLPWGASRAGDL